MVLHPVCPDHRADTLVESRQKLWCAIGVRKHAAQVFVVINVVDERLVVRSSRENRVDDAERKAVG